MSSNYGRINAGAENGCSSVEAAFAPCLEKMAEMTILLRCAHKQNQKALKAMRLAFKKLDEASRHLENSTITKIVCQGQKSALPVPRHTTYRELVLNLRV